MGDGASPAGLPNDVQPGVPSDTAKSGSGEWLKVALVSLRTAGLT